MKTIAPIPPEELTRLNQEIADFNAQFSPGVFVTAYGAHAQISSTPFIWRTRIAWQAVVWITLLDFPVRLDAIRSTPVQEPT